MQNQFKNSAQQNQSWVQSSSGKQHLAGVKCVVSNCFYHEQGDHCSAPGIEIQHRQASEKHETDCSTFEAK